MWSANVPEALDVRSASVNWPGVMVAASAVAGASAAPAAVTNGAAAIPLMIVLRDMVMR